MREIDGARDRVVVQRPGDQLAGVVVDDLLQQRLADALRHAAVDLPAHQRRADDHPTVVDGDELHQLHFARVGKTSTTATWVPNGKVSSSGRKYSVASSPAPSSAGSASE